MREGYINKQWGKCERNKNERETQKTIYGQNRRNREQEREIYCKIKEIGQAQRGMDKVDRGSPDDVRQKG